MTPFDKLLDMLDLDQRRVADWTPASGNLRVIASAGSGKTSSLVALACNLVVKDVVPASQMVVTTFTKKAGDELRNRMGKIIDRDTLNKMRLGTFHAIGLQVLRSENPKEWDMKRCIDLSTGRDVSIPGAAAIWRAIVSYGKVPGSGRDSLQLSLPPEFYRKQIELWRSAGARNIVEADVPAGMTIKECDEFEQVWDYFNEAKERLRAWDFTDVLQAWHDLVWDRAPTESIVLVDEAQDNNRLQLDIAQGLAREGGRICLIGDPKQAIYQFRGAYPKLFNEAETLLDAKTREIRTNYRSLPHIIEFANQFIADKPWNHNAPALPYRTIRDEQETVKTLCAASLFEEADQVAGEIAEAILENQATAGDYLILTRTNAARFAFETALVGRGIPNVVLGSYSAFNTKEASQVLAYCVLAQFNHLDSLDKILNVPKRFIPRTFVNEVSNEMRHVSDMVEAMKSALTTTRMKPGSKRGVVDLVRELETLRRLPWKEVPGAVEKLLRKVDDQPEDEPDEDRMGMVRSVCALAAMFPDAQSLVKFAETCTQSTATQAENENSDRVTISTIHKIKGCEAKSVYVSASANLFPHVKTTNRPEEERLFYVAITRARNDLTITSNASDGGKTSFLRD